MVFAPRWLQIGGTQNTELWKADIGMDSRIILKYKIDYLQLALKISKIRFIGAEPPNELMAQARALGVLAGVSEAELNKL